MVIGIGCDIMEHSLVELLKWESDISLLNRIFSLKELEIYNINKKKEFLAGRFAAKEAVLKCLGTGMQDGIALNEIHILQSGNGKPFIELKGDVKEISDKMGICQWHISITHATNYSIAFAVAEGK